jgi:hypothetical protein
MTKELTLESLGISSEALTDKLVDRLAERVLEGAGYDEESGEWSGRTTMGKRINAMVQAKVDETVTAIADKHIQPLVSTLIENAVFQETNQWGEPKKPPMTFKEYLAVKSETWLREQVNYQGKTRDEDSYNWSAKNTRIAHMVHQHLDYHIKDALTKAFTNLNAQVAGGLEQAVKMQLAGVLKGLNVSVATSIQK